MLVGLCIAIVGLAYFSLHNPNRYGGRELFKILSGFMWRLEYYLDLDMPEGFRIMNVGSSLYIFGAIYFPLSYISKRRVKLIGFFAALIMPLALSVIYDPAFITWAYGANKPAAYAMVNKQISEMYQVLNLIVNYGIKLSIIISTGILIFVQKTIVPVIRKKFIYMIIGIVPIHILFLVLFYWFPNHSIAYKRFYLLYSISAPYNEFLYGFITYFCVFSIILLIYAMWKYNIFDISVRKNRIDFQRQMNTAHVGLKVFSHSIKNQMIAIKMLAEQLESTVDENRKSFMAKEIVNICNDSIVKLGASSNNTKIIRLKYENVSVPDYIRKVISKYENKHKNIDFLIDIRNGLLLYIDEAQFEKVMDNLVINAIEACGSRDKPFIKITIEERDNYGVITIEDNGSGIESKNIKKIFEPFFSTKPMSSNWGIGLSHCQKVIEAFGGVIEIESKENEGTKIYIFIPKYGR